MLKRLDIEECEIYRGFYHTPLSTRLVVSEEGHVIDLILNMCILPRLTAMGYLVIDTNGEGTHLLHRLLASAFLDSYNSIDVLVVNHKDGDKLNNRLSNLEWCTYSENAFHAYRTGLRFDNRFVIVKDLRDGSIIEFYSLQECARYFGKNGEAIHRYLNGNMSTPFMLYYAIIYKGDNWPALTINDVGKVPNGAPKSVVVEDIVKKVFVLYPSAGAAATALGIKQSTFYQLVNKAEGEKVPYNGLVFHFRDLLIGKDCIIVDSGITLAKPVPPKRKPVPVWVTNTVTEERQHYDSVELFATDHHTTKNTIQKSMLLKEGRWRHFNIQYVTNTGPTH